MGKFIELGSKVSCIFILIVQGLLLNAYLEKRYSSIWWSWTVADVSIIIVWSSLIWVSRRKAITKENSKAANEDRYTFIGWLYYAVFLCPRIVLLFKNLAKTLNETEVLGPNFLKMSASFTPLIYFLLVMGSHSTVECDLKGTALSGALDLFDSIDLLEFLFLPLEDVKCPAGYLHASLAFACISMFLPALSLYGLRHKAEPGRVTSVMFGVSYEVVNLLLINLPNLVIRSVLWHRFSMDVSVLLMKNVMGVVAGSHEIYEYFGEPRPVRCNKCDDWFTINAHKHHKTMCGELNDESFKLTPTVNSIST